MNASRVWIGLLTAAVLAILAGATGCGSPELVANPNYQAWANFEPGSYATLEGVRKTTTQPEAICVLQRLVERTADHVLLERTVTPVSSDQPETVTRKVEPRMIPPQENPRTRSGAVRTELAPEDIDVGGKRYACRVIDVEAHPRYEGLFPTSEDFHMRVWINPQIPGGTVKLVLDRKSTSHSLELSTLLVEFQSAGRNQK